jgi:hypothetical protein
MGGRLCNKDVLIGTVANAEALGWDLYLNLNPGRASSPGRKKLAREDISVWRYVVLDVDPAGEVLAPPDPPLSKFAHIRMFSGRGYQFWLPVNPPKLIPDAERLTQGWLRHIAKSIEEWGPGWKVDTACSDLARVVRCPGSVNQKTGRRATIERICSILSKNWIAPSDLRPYIMPQPEFTNWDFTIEGVSFMDVLPYLNGRSKQFIMHGVESGERHNACFATCKNLQELGVERSRAADWLAIGAQRCFRKLNLVNSISDPLAPLEIKRIVGRVYGGG